MQVAAVKSPSPRNGNQTGENPVAEKSRKDVHPPPYREHEDCGGNGYKK
jgi:hypothetical protein